MEHEIVAYCDRRGAVHYVAYKGVTTVVIYCTEERVTDTRARGRVSCLACIAKRQQRGDKIAKST